MTEILELAKGMTTTGWKILYAVLSIAAGLYIIDRGRKAAAREKAEESRDRRVA